MAIGLRYITRSRTSIITPVSINKKCCTASVISLCGLWTCADRPRSPADIGLSSRHCPAQWICCNTPLNLRHFLCSAMLQARLACVSSPCCGGGPLRCHVPRRPAATVAGLTRRSAVSSPAGPALYRRVIPNGASAPRLHARHSTVCGPTTDSPATPDVAAAPGTLQVQSEWSHASLRADSRQHWSGPPGWGVRNRDPE